MIHQDFWPIFEAAEALRAPLPAPTVAAADRARRLLRWTRTRRSTRPSPRTGSAGTLRDRHATRAADSRRRFRPLPRPAGDHRALGRANAYSSKANRAYLRRHGIQAVISSKGTRRPTGSRVARPEAARPTSTLSGTKNATASSGVSTCGSSARWPRASTSANASTRAPSSRVHQDLAPRPRSTIQEHGLA